MSVIEMKTSENFGRQSLRRARERNSEAFNVGLLIPTSGAMGLLGPSAYACARLARDMWNERGGFHGREIRLSVLNSSESERSLDDHLAEMLAARQLDALVTLSNTAVCRRIAAVVDARAPLIYTPLFEGGGLPAWVHAIGETPDRQLLPAIDWLSGRYRARRWYLLGNDYCWPRRSHRLAIPFIRGSGAEVVAERYVPLGERSFGPIIDEIVASRADAVLVSLLAGDAVHMCREFGRAGLSHKVLRLSPCIEENTVLGIGNDHTDGMFVAAGYFASIDSDVNGAFKERYHALCGDRAPTLNSASQSVYEGFVHLHRQSLDPSCRRPPECLPGVRDSRRQAYDARSNPVFLGEVEGLGIRVSGTLAGAPE